MLAPPTVFRAHRADREFEIEFSDQVAARVPFRTFRWHCPCAMCVDEMTGVRILKWENVPADIAPVKLEPSGNYALKITWSDGHASGIYTWDRIRQIVQLRVGSDA